MPARSAASKEVHRTEQHRPTTHKHTHKDTHITHTDTQTHTDTHRHTDTQTHRHTDTQTHRHTPLLRYGARHSAADRTSEVWRPASAVSLETLA